MKKVIVTGMTDGKGASALLDGGKWCGVVLLRPWRAPDGKVHAELLHVRLPPSADSPAAMKESARIRRKGCLRLEVVLLPKRPNMLTAAILVGRATRVKPSPDLAATDAKLSEVVAVRDPHLGRLQRQPKADVFVGNLRLLGRRAALEVEHKNDRTPQATIARAASLLRKLQPKLADKPARIAKTLLKLARHWQEDDGQPPITAQTLERQLRLTTVVVPPEANQLVLFFDCGDVFADHGVMAKVSAQGRLLTADIC